MKGSPVEEGVPGIPTKPAQIRAHVHLCCCTNNVSRLIHPIQSFIYDSRPFWGGTPLIKKANRGCDSLVSQNSRLVLHTYIITTTNIYLAPKRLLFFVGGFNHQNRGQILCIYIYIYLFIYTYTYIYIICICFMLIYTMFSPYQKTTPPLEFAASTAKAKFES